MAEHFTQLLKLAIKAGLRVEPNNVLGSEGPVTLGRSAAAASALLSIAIGAATLASIPSDTTGTGSTKSSISNVVERAILAQGAFDTLTALDSEAIEDTGAFDKISDTITNNWPAFRPIGHYFYPSISEAVLRLVIHASSDGGGDHDTSLEYQPSSSKPGNAVVEDVVKGVKAYVAAQNGSDAEALGDLFRVGLGEGVTSIDQATGSRGVKHLQTLIHQSVGAKYSSVLSDALTARAIVGETFLQFLLNNHGDERLGAEVMSTMVKTTSDIAADVLALAPNVITATEATVTAMQKSRENASGNAGGIHTMGLDLNGPWFTNDGAGFCNVM